MANRNVMEELSRLQSEGYALDVSTKGDRVVVFTSREGEKYGVLVVSKKARDFLDSFGSKKAEAEDSPARAPQHDLGLSPRASAPVNDPATTTRPFTISEEAARRNLARSMKKKKDDENEKGVTRSSCYPTGDALKDLRERFARTPEVHERPDFHREKSSSHHKKSIPILVSREEQEANRARKRQEADARNAKRRAEAINRQMQKAAAKEAKKNKKKEERAGAHAA